LVKVPPDVAIRASIKLGSVYYFSHENFPEQPHYFIVIGINPLSKEIILLVNASSKVAKVKAMRKDCPPNTLVVVRPQEYSGFNRVSIVDCNQVWEHRIEQLVQKLSNKSLQMKPEMDVRLVRKLRQGVLASQLIAPRIKAQLGIR
jgi:hypothetical protein